MGDDEIIISCDVCTVNICASGHIVGQQPNMGPRNITQLHIFCNLNIFHVQRKNYKRYNLGKDSPVLPIIAQHLHGRI